MMFRGKSRHLTAFAGVMLGILILSMLAVFLTQPLRTSYAAGAAYNWNQLKIGAGGYVTGTAIHPTASGLMYVRTDVGGHTNLEQMILGNNFSRLMPFLTQH